VNFLKIRKTYSKFDCIGNLMSIFIPVDMFSPKMSLSVIGWAIGTLIIPMDAAAQVAELRLGIAQFDEEIFDLDGNRPGRGDETSVAISGEILFEEPKILKWALSPQPYIGGTVNLEGETSFGGGGLLWRQTVSKKFYGDLALGLVAHTGTREIGFSDEFFDLIEQLDEFDNPDDVPMELSDALNAAFDERFEREDEEIEFGTRILFRLQAAIGYNVNEDWAGEIYLEHLSNGQGSIFENDVNEGVNSFGIRASRKF